MIKSLFTAIAAGFIAGQAAAQASDAEEGRAGQGVLAWILAAGAAGAWVLMQH
jgi:hypothetical protein